MLERWISEEGERGNVKCQKGRRGWGCRADSVFTVACVAACAVDRNGVADSTNGRQQLPSPIFPWSGGVVGRLGYASQGLLHFATDQKDDDSVQ